MNIRLNLPKPIAPVEIKITGSKSETNRLLLLQALYPEISLTNISESDDSAVMQHALLGNDSSIDVHHAGTAMRFLTAYFAIQQDREVILTGSARMKERPISILVAALQSLGAQIEYLEKEGYPPLKIKGRKITKDKVTLKADVSSQYITALLLIAPKLENGLEVILEGEITSRPYIMMTLSLLNENGATAIFANNTIKVIPLERVTPKNVTVESDWSSASYFYAIIALSEPGTRITLSSYKEDSLQGDSVLAEIYENLGVNTEYNDDSIILQRTAFKPEPLNLNLINSPDIAQTMAVTCFGLGIACTLTGLHTLKIKETDRLEALKKELKKLGAEISVTNDSLYLSAEKTIANTVQRIDTYNDHRMAMAFAPLAVRIPLIINNAEVVSKSYPEFWNDMKTLGFSVSEL